MKCLVDLLGPSCMVVEHGICYSNVVYLLGCIAYYGYHLLLISLHNDGS
jgi:hypothetical protein